MIPRPVYCKRCNGWITDRMNINNEEEFWDYHRSIDDCWEEMNKRVTMIEKRLTGFIKSDLRNPEETYYWQQVERRKKEYNG